MNMGIRLLLVVLSAGLSIAVFPPIGWSAFALIAWFPLLFALREVKPSHALYLGLLHGVVFFAVTMSWVLNIFEESKGIIVPLVLIMALFTALFARGYAVAQGRYGSGWVTAAFAACWWTATEFYRSEIFYLKFPWLTPGVGLGPTFISPILGVSGASFVIIFTAALLCQKKKHCITGAIMIAVLLAAMVVQKTRSMPVDEPIHIAAVQNEDFNMDYYLELSRGVEGNPDIIIWPEYALSYDVQKHPKDMQKLYDLAAEKDSVIVVGTHKEIDESSRHNTALTLNKGGALGEHHKNHTVHFFDDGVAGTEAKAVDTGKWKIGTPICFDCDYQDVIRRMTASGAEFFTIPSMDGIHWGDKEHYQHAELFRHRAAENGRWIAVAATSGVTQVLDPYGNRVHALPIIEDGVLTAELGARSELTFYTRGGWLFPWAILIGSVIWVLVICVQGFKEKAQSKDKRIA